MLDYLYPFFYISTAFSVIGKELAHKLASIGGIWFNILYLWILYAVYDDWQDQDLPSHQVGTYLVWFFVVSNAFITIVELLQYVKFINLPSCWILENATSTILKITFPYMLWRFVYVPSNLAFNMAILVAFGQCTVWYCTCASSLLAFFATSIVVSYVCQSPGMVGAERTKRKYTRRATPVAKRTRSSTVDTSSNKRSRSTSRRK